MSYKVIKAFVDLQDNNHEYKVGDAFPRKGVTATNDRTEELLSESNKQGAKLIEEVKEVKEAKKPRNATPKK